MENPKKLLKEHGIEPKKSLGQNFLMHEGPVFQLLHAAEITKEDMVVEVGPGLGIVTKRLVLSAGQVVAIEKDEKLSEILRQELKDFLNLKVLTQDILEWKPPMKKYKVIGNLPYAIATPIIRKFLQEKQTPESMTFMLQKEVAQRITAKPPKMNILAVSVQLYANPRIISYVKKNVFWPQPKVDSAILHIPDIKKPTDINIDAFFSVVKAGFAHPRKQLINNISEGLNITKEDARDFLTNNGVDPILRAETLYIENWVKLAKDDIMKKHDSRNK